LIGENPDLTYDYEHLGAGTETLTDLAAGKHSFADVLKNAKNPIVLVGRASRPVTTARLCWRWLPSSHLTSA
jgi:hypothetical protein